MGEYIHDDELDQLVRELNSKPKSVSVAPDEPLMRGMVPSSLLASQPATEPAAVAVEAGAEDEGLGELVDELLARRGSDLLLVPGERPVVRLDGRLERLPASAVTETQLRRWLTLRLSPYRRGLLERRGAVDFSLRLASSSHGEWRFRVNLHRQRGRLAAALRALPARPSTFEQLVWPGQLGELVKPLSGLVLLCGPTGCGKSSTLAALTALVARGRPCHIVTIEDPIEYELTSDNSLIEQIEVGSDSPGFAAALRASLRQDPDVLLVGEMRDLETVSTALTAAETGHLVLSSLHTNDAAQTIHRIVDVFPAEQQNQVRQQLALSLQAIVCQQLVPRADGKGRVPALELLRASYAVRQQIRGGKLQNLYNEMLQNRRNGMIPLEASLARLVRGGQIELDEARLRAVHPEQLEDLLRG